MDTRSVYTLLSIASLLNLLTPQLTDNVTQFLLDCQTYEGGFGGERGNEAHGGYTFCAFASLVILKSAHKCRLGSLEVRSVV